MIGWGVALIIIGAGSLLLPMFNYQFTLMELVDDYQPYAGIVVAVIGAVARAAGDEPADRSRPSRKAASRPRRQPTRPRRRRATASIASHSPLEPAGHFARGEVSTRCTSGASVPDRGCAS